MEYGIMLPTLDKCFDLDGEMDRLKKLKKVSRLRLWFRDLPATQDVDGDEGLGMDPFLAIQYMLFKHRHFKLGIGVLNVAFRNVMLMIRELITLGNLENIDDLIIGVGSGEKEFLFQDSRLSWNLKKNNFSSWLLDYKDHFNSIDSSGIINVKNHYYSMGDLNSLPKISIASKDFEIINEFSDIIENDIVWLTSFNDLMLLKQKINHKRIIMFLPIRIDNNVGKINIEKYLGRDVLVMSEKILELYLEKLELAGVSEIIFSFIPGEDLSFLDRLYYQ